MTTTKNIWGITRKETAVLDTTANTTNSRYQLVEFTPFRKFATRAAARKYKQSLKQPQAYAIVNTQTGIAVR